MNHPNIHIITDNKKLRRKIKKMTAKNIKNGKRLLENSTHMLKKSTKPLFNSKITSKNSVTKNPFLFIVAISTMSMIGIMHLKRLVVRNTI